MNQILAFFTRRNLYLSVSRYLLGITMIPYGLTKILKTQFVLTGFSLAQLQTLESIPGTTLAWAFLGHSLWFQVLLGFLELIPAILLLFRRTTLLGAVLMLPVTLNVFLINYALDLWVGTKVVGGGLLILNIMVLIFHWAKIKSMFRVIVDRGVQIKFTKVEIGINMALITIVGYFALEPLIEYRNQRNELTGDWFSRQPIEWMLEKEESGDSTLAARDLKVYFGAYGKYDEAGASSYSYDVSYTIDAAKRIITLKYDDGNVVNCKYELTNGDELKIDKLPGTVKDEAVTQYFKKRIINGGK